MKRKQHREHSPVEAKSEESARLAAQLAPLEEQAGGEQKEENHHRQAGAIVVDTARLKIPSGIVDEEKDDSGFFGFSPVVLLIFVLAIVFIGFITYLISIEPTQASGVGN